MDGPRFMPGLDRQTAIVTVAEPDEGMHHGTTSRIEIAYQRVKVFRG